jgi:hypothetical protein
MRLDARHDIAGPRRAHDRDLADAFEQRLEPCRDGRVRAGARRQLDQRHEIGRIEPMGVEEPFRMRHRARQVVDQDRRRGRGDDRSRARKRGCARQRLALEIQHLGDAFEDHRCSRERRGRLRFAHHRDPCNDAIDLVLREQPQAREELQRAAHLLRRLGREPGKGRGIARLEVDERDGMTGIGERHCNATPHAASTQGGDTRALVHGKPSRRRDCKAARSR